MRISTKMLRKFLGISMVMLFCWASDVFAENFLFVGTYHTRASPQACAEGAYLVKDAVTKEARDAARNSFMANEAYKDKDPARYERGQVVAIYRYQAKDHGAASLSDGCTYTRYGSLSARSTAEAEKALKQRYKEHSFSFLTEPAIVQFWQGENLEKK